MVLRPGGPRAWRQWTAVLRRARGLTPGAGAAPGESALRRAPSGTSVYAGGGVAGTRWWTWSARWNSGPWLTSGGGEGPVSCVGVGVSRRGSAPVGRRDTAPVGGCVPGRSGAAPVPEAPLLARRPRSRGSGPERYVGVCGLWCHGDAVFRPGGSRVWQRRAVVLRTRLAGRGAVTGRLGRAGALTEWPPRGAGPDGRVRRRLPVGTGGHSAAPPGQGPARVVVLQAFTKPSCGKAW